MGRLRNEHRLLIPHGHRPKHWHYHRVIWQWVTQQMTHSISPDWQPKGALSMSDLRHGQQVEEVLGVLNICRDAGGLGPQCISEKSCMR
eukprot:6484235-Amphidinium_carterae.3